MKGYTLIEVIIVVGVLAIMTGLASLSLVSFGQAGDIETAQTMVLGALKEAQANSEAQIDDKLWGVHLETGRVVIFADSGSGYAANAKENSVRVLPNKTNLSWNLTDGGDSLEFSIRSGKPINPGMITLSGTAAKTQELTINAQGMIE